VLLDLLGARGPRVPSYFQSTHWAYQHMAHVESRLRSLHLLRSSPNHPVRAAARASSKPRVEPTFLHDSTKPDAAFRSGGYVLDDHVPFMQRGVEILHLIPSPFPRVWHEIEDDGAHLDTDTVEDWARIVAVFAAEWMELEGFLDGEGEQHVDAEKDEL
jgi:glutaminyl-peptide cyclotransferase